MTSSGAHLRGLAPGQHSSEGTSQRWRAVSDTVPDLTGSVIKPKTSRTDSDGFNKYASRPVQFFKYIYICKNCILGANRITSVHEIRSSNKIRGTSYFCFLLGDYLACGKNCFTVFAFVNATVEILNHKKNCCFI